MDFLQGVDIGTLVLICGGLGLVCVVGLLLLFGFQVIGATIFNAVELFMTLLSGGPVMWCGCLVLLAACLLCVGGVLVYSTCTANPSSMNFCLLFTGGM